MWLNKLSTLVVSYLLLAVIGSVILWSIAPDKLGQQVIILVFGFLLILYLASQDAAIFDNFTTPIYIMTILLLASTFILGDVIRGSVRWIDILGFRLQTSEFAKPLLILAFAGYLKRYPPITLRNITIQLLIVLLPTFLIFRQPDLGTSLVIGFIWVIMVFIARLPLWVVGIGGGAIALIASYSGHFLKPYQLARLQAFFDPYQDPLGSGYNVIQAIIAVGSGQIFGKGLGHGTQSHYRFLPERHTDFMFASLAEELGLVGGAIVIFIFALIIFRLVSSMLKAKDSYSRLVLAGVFGYFFFQTGINIGMNLGIAPVTGVTLPLISYGGSSVLATSLILGLALSSEKQVRSQKPVIEIK